MDGICGAVTETGHWKRTVKSIQRAETDKSTRLRILITVFFKKKKKKTRTKYKT